MEKKKHIDLTEFAFMDGKNQEEFSEKLKVELKAELKKSKWNFYNHYSKIIIFQFYRLLF